MGKTAGDKGQLELDICNELDMIVPAERPPNAAQSPKRPSRLCEAAGDRGQSEPNLSDGLEKASSTRNAPDVAGPVEGQPECENTRGVKRPLSPGEDAVETEMEDKR